MASKVDLCNMALSHLGATEIALFDEATKNARICRRFYDQTRDAVLRDHPWGFAEREQVMALLGGQSSVRYEYAYQYPSDCLKIRSVEAANPIPGAKPIDYKKVSKADGTGPMILSDEANAVIIYTVRITDVNAFDASFIDAFALKMASVMATPVTKKTTKALNFLQLYHSYLGTAKTTDAQELVDNTEADCDFIEARK